jgi:hypothetical protein
VTLRDRVLAAPDKVAAARLVLDSALFRCRFRPENPSRKELAAYRWCEGSVLALIEALDDERAASDEQKGGAE